MYLSYRYKVSSFPHICVLDPRTGAVIWKYEKKINKELFSEKLLDFLGSNPYPEVTTNKNTDEMEMKNIDLTGKDEGGEGGDSEEIARAMSMSLGGEGKQSIFGQKKNKTTISSSNGNSSSGSSSGTSSDSGGFDPLTVSIR